ncbi:AraC family transcriptional regulator [Azohydromonas australica]|uniref:AraC family transcriptional regulator n=1 Tax=Azohydromonas australica TaxID=364039 RepID=UPI0012EC4B63|nr:AraC family transcriptional regulator [Azohydromonas australica]
MVTITSQATPAEASAEQVQLVLLRAELATRIERHTGFDGVHSTAIPRLTLVRVSTAQHPVHSVYEPAFCVLAQGAKRVLLGDEVYVYDGSHYLVASQDLPVAGHVVDASPETPYLGLKLDLDAKDIASLALDLGRDGRLPSRSPQRGIFTGELTAALLEPVLRLIKLLDSPRDISTLAPLVLREILYRLLSSEEGWRIAQLAVVDGHSQRVARAIDWLRQRFHEQLRVEELAREAHMSVSSLHHHFKAVTAMSPLQYQKQLRLQEARQVMLSENIDAATAGHRVGYESPSQFSREYSRFFGAPPARDIKRLREQQISSRPH